jgi:hypothetical protein
MSRYCTVRVWDNGDMTSCDREVLRADRCSSCLSFEVKTLTQQIRGCEEALKKLRARLTELQVEQG